MIDLLDSIPIHERPWPGLHANSIQYEVGERGMAARVTALATPGTGRMGNISWRKGCYRSPDEAEAIALEILAAVAKIRRVQADVSVST